MNNENRNYGRKNRNNGSPVLTTVIFAVIAVVAAIAVFVVSNGKDGKNTKPETNIETESLEEYFESENKTKHIAHFIDVGQADSTLIETKNGKFVLIDAATGDAEEKLLKYLDDRNVSEIEYVVFTHPHEDHIGSGDAVLENYKVKNVLMTDKSTNTACFERLLDAVADSKEKNKTNVVKAQNGYSFSVEDLNFLVVSDGSKYDDLNDSSICIRLECGQSSFLFTGDAEKDVEEDMLLSDFKLESDIFKCAHHGSSTSNTEEFLDKVNPKVVVISCGEDNSYGHPHKEVLERLNERNISYHRTDTEGDIIFAFDDKEIKFLEKN